MCYCAILVFNKWNTTNSLPLYIVKTDACVICNYTARECLLLPGNAAMLGVVDAGLKPASTTTRIIQAQLPFVGVNNCTC